MRIAEAMIETELQALECSSEERDLVRRLCSGDSQAFDEFAGHYIPALQRFASNRIRRDPELVRDIVQATVCHAIEKLTSFRCEAPLMVWLYACCRNEISAHFRRAQNRVHFTSIDGTDEDAPLQFATPECDPEVEAIERQEEQMVHRTLDHLPPRHAAVLQWKYLEDASVDEIARRLEVSEKAAESLLTRARSGFRAMHHELKARTL